MSSHRDDVGWASPTIFLKGGQCPPYLVRGTSWRVISSGILVCLLLGGCASSSPAPISLTEEQFAALYDDHQAVTDVWYMGSDSQYNYFCMEHWTANADGTNATMDKRSFYEVALAELDVKHPFAYTHDEDQWRLLRPKKLPPA